MMWKRILGVAIPVVGVTITVSPLPGTAAWRTSPGVDAPQSGSAAVAVPNDNRAPAGRLLNGALTLQLEARDATWYPEDTAGAALPVYAFAEAGKPASVPGPLIRVPVGTEIQVSFRNSLARPVRLRGLQSRAGASLDSITVEAGATQEIRFRADVPGTFLYYGRTQALPAQPSPGRARDASLVGAFIVDPAGTTVRPDERILLITMWRDTLAALGIKSAEADLILRRENIPRNFWLVFAVNGRSWPKTERLSYSEGDTVRWRVINGAAFPHPMHLHGFHFNVTARGDALLDTVYTPEQRRTVVTEWMVAGSTMSMTWAAERAGNWLFHCHFVTHISDANRAGAHSAHTSAGHGNHAEQGMAGLVMGINVAPRTGAPPAPDLAPRRQLRLFVTERANVFGNLPGYSYVLQEGQRPPAADSIRPIGSTIVLRQNEPTEITVRNLTNHATSVHWHGIELESYFDGVGDWSGWGSRVAPVIAPGDSFVVRMTPPRAGTFMYHTHASEGVKLTSGLYGPLIVVPTGASVDSTQHVYMASFGGPHDEGVPVVNGESSLPAVEVMSGVAHRFRLINISAVESHTFQLTAGGAVQRWRALAKDGAELPSHQATTRPATISLHPGETFDVEVLRDRPDSLALTVVSVPSLASRRAAAAARGAGRGSGPNPRVVTTIPILVR
jgi:FtsP/CotA-like multicopper oxidase with cupredoxin domain